MPNDESVSAVGGVHARPDAGEAQARVVRHFRQIVLWPIQLIASSPDARGARTEALFARHSAGNWALVDDEFGIKGDAFRNGTTASS